MGIEKVRGCGYRKVGGLYLCGSGLPLVCDRLPYLLEVCPTCGAGIKFTRGFTWIDWDKYASNHEDCEEVFSGTFYPEKLCPICRPDMHQQPYGLLWCGESFYTPGSFIKEALEMGVSKRIAAVPKNLKLGETWILFAHKKAVQMTVVENVSELWEQTRETGKAPDINEVGQLVDVPGIFYAFRPQRLELLIWQKDATDEKLAELEKKGITPVIIPDGDVDHDPRTSLKPKEEERAGVFFESLRESIREGE